MGGADLTTRMLKQYRESQVEKLRYKKIKPKKIIDRSRKIMGNTNFGRDQKNFIKKIEREKIHVG